MNFIKIFFLILVISFSRQIKGFAQDINFTLPTDSSVALGVISPYSRIGTQFSDYSSYYDKTIDKKIAVPIVGAKKGRSEYRSYEIVYKGKVYFIDAKAIETNPNTFQAFMDMDEEKANAYKKFMTETFLLDHYNKITKALDWIKSTAPQGLVLLKRQVYDESEYTDGTGIEFEFINSGKKSIKYIWFNFTGYNAVDDPVLGMKTRKGIGPIEPEESGSYTYEYVWHTDIVEYARLNSIKIQYMDNTFKTLSSATLSKLFMPDEHKNLLED